MSMCHLQGHCWAQGKPSRSVSQRMHSNVISTAFLITRMKTQAPRQHAPAPDLQSLPTSMVSFGFQKLFPLYPYLPVPSPIAGPGIPFPRVFHAAHLTLKLQPVLSQTLFPRLSSCVPKHPGGTNWSQCPHYPYSDLILPLFID